jgi:hypothetical protein
MSSLSFKNDILYFLLVSFNYFSDLISYYNQKIKELFELYNDTNRNKWVFFNENNQIVLPLNSIKNITNETKWIYNADTNKLINSESNNKIKINWLSVELINYIDINLQNPITEIINLDKFFESFELYTDNNNPPSVFHLIYCIYIKNKKWYSSNDNIKLIIIDDMANDICLDINNDTIMKYKLNINSNNELSLSLTDNN